MALVRLLVTAVAVLATASGCSGDRELPEMHLDDGGTGPTVNDSGADEPDGLDGGEVCDEITVPVSRVTPKVLIILDRSNSMRDHSNWTTIREALVEITGELERRLAFGLMVFPATEGRSPCDVGLNGCSAPSAPNLGCAAGRAREIASAVDDMPTCGGTPTAATLRAAADYFVQSLDPTHVPNGPGVQSYVVVATDGAPNCNESLDGESCRCTALDACEQYPANCLDDERTYEAIEALAAVHVPVFVLGISASRWRDVLDEMAVLGGTGAAYMAEEPGDMYTALAEITRGLTSCEVTIGEPGPTAEPELVNLYLDGARIPMADDAYCAGGWRWVDEEHKRVAFCGVACALLRAGEVDRVTATFGCPTLI